MRERGRKRVREEGREEESWVQSSKKRGSMVIGIATKTKREVQRRRKRRGREEKW